MQVGGDAGLEVRVPITAGPHTVGVSFVREMWEFLRENKKWWLVPLVLVVLVLSALVILSSTAAAPFIYTLF